MKKFNILINEMLINCVHLGHKKKFLNKEMKEFVIENKSEISIINLEKTFKQFIDALKVIKRVIELNKIILTVCSKPKFKIIIKKASDSINMPYINSRWLSGTLTNFNVIKSVVDRMKFKRIFIKNHKESMRKRDFFIFKRKQKLLERKYTGVERIEKIPDLIFVIDAKKHKNSLVEAKKMGIPTIAIVDTDSSLKNVDFPIVGNDDSFKSIIFYLKYITKVIKDTRASLR